MPAFGHVQNVSTNVCSGSGEFETISGLLSMIEVATDGSVFGVNYQGNLYQSFINIPGLLSMIEVATDGSVFGVNSQGNLYQRTGVTRSKPDGTDWISMVACPNGHKHVSFDLGVLWLVCVDGSIRKCILTD
ncbi:hypothetical protein cypCar_00031366 [Cyprinus carpio]|nr:hypothetical protein cypCar_00031366 [Cyprinus carpio]